MSLVISQFIAELGVATGSIIPPTDTGPTRTVSFDGEGLGETYYLVLQLSDYGGEIRDHVLKAVDITGRFSDARVKLYRYGPTEPVTMSELENGTGYTAVVELDTTTQVELSQRFPVNIPNARMSTIRIEGEWDGNSPRDRIDQAVVEAATQGIRR